MTIKKITVGDYRTNCYVANIGPEVVIIDPGEGATQIVEEVEKIQGANLRYILLTHGHFDHVMSIDDLALKYPQVSILIHKDDVKLLRETVAQGSFVMKRLGRVTSDVTTVDDGFVIPFAETDIKVIHTPGHTKGSVCYRLGEYLFTGDTIFYHAYGRTDLPWSQPDKMEDSIDSILNLSEGLKILPGHGRESDVAEERRYRDSLR